MGRMNLADAGDGKPVCLMGTPGVRLRPIRLMAATRTVPMRGQNFGAACPSHFNWSLPTAAPWYGFASSDRKSGPFLSLTVYGREPA